MYIAQGSASEIDTQLEVALKLNYIDESEKDRLDAKLDTIGKMLTGLIRSVKNES